ncbi:response regulator [Celeribacter indicus]|uniref:Two-component response regulator n=1 Tax=Celeribacter indicus TaxID=1208324 RepID=A0A0B5DRQ5_9RHOB|nr:response regulator [Celeribacter indicus]AJE46208.1 two-component response regulator [Celeribacter indicus]SDW50017.1 response regulator receiver protein [Celeribacter indicus]
MSQMNETAGLADKIAQHLPYLRRYARALTGSQSSGDAYAMATLEALLEDRSVFDQVSDAKIALFRAFHVIWNSAGAPVAEEDGTLARRAQAHMSKLTPNSREVLLLATIEGFSTKDIAEIIGTGVGEVEGLLGTARTEMEDSVAGRVLIIEDEAIIALDLQAIVAEMGHEITGVARTHKGAVQLADRERPDLILSDIQLADNSSGIEAVNEILAEAGDIPVIFITAFPERLLTGERPEPAFVITKPYSEEQVLSAVSQAMFFSSTESLTA